MTAPQTSDRPPAAAITHLGPGGRAPEELRATLSAAAGVVGGANIVMQLALLPVGHGVAESRVDSGSLYKHPIKRARTTFGYVMIALFGTDEEREILAEEVTAVHRQVRNGPGEAVRYTAMDPQLQLWVAACIYRGLEDAHTLLHGPPTPEHLDVLYPHAARLATTLQVPPSMWPADRQAFEDYWDAAVREIRMDDVTRAYLYDFAGLGFLPRPLPQVLGRFHRTITAGFLPEPFREELGLAWGPREQRTFSATCRMLRTLNTIAPRPLRALPFDLYLWDMRRRIHNRRHIL
jgi:uncharacterized protein (DUF2236 family)